MSNWMDVNRRATAHLIPRVGPLHRADDHGEHLGPGEEPLRAQGHHILVEVGRRLFKEVRLSWCCCLPSHPSSPLPRTYLWRITTSSKSATRRLFHKPKFSGKKCTFSQRVVLEQPGKVHFFPSAKLTIGKHESIFLEEVQFFVWFFPKKSTSSRKIYSNFRFWNSLLDQKSAVPKTQTLLKLFLFAHLGNRSLGGEEVHVPVDTQLVVGFIAEELRLLECRRAVLVALHRGVQLEEGVEGWRQLYKDRSFRKTDSQWEKRSSGSHILLYLRINFLGRPTFIQFIPVVPVFWGPTMRMSGRRLQDLDSDQMSMWRWSSHGFCEGKKLLWGWLLWVFCLSFYCKSVNRKLTTIDENKLKLLPLSIK